MPTGFTLLPSNGYLPKSQDLEEIEFYVPAYMSGKDPLKIIPGMSTLKIVQSLNAGYEDVLEYLPRGVVLCNAAGVHDASTAELAIALAIGARRGFSKFAVNQQESRWSHSREQSLTDSVVGVVGYGNIGKLIVSVLRNFETTVYPFSRSGSNDSIEMKYFDDYLPKLDLVILIMPLNENSRNFMSADRLSRMKDGASLVNVARGAVVDTDALVRELNSGRITAGLDVTNPEPLPADHQLWKARNVIITPHVGGDSSAFEPRGRRLVEEQLNRLARKENLINIVAGPLTS